MVKFLSKYFKNFFFYTLKVTFKMLISLMRLKTYLFYLIKEINILKVSLVWTILCNIFKTYFCIVIDLSQFLIFYSILNFVCSSLILLFSTQQLLFKSMSKWWYLQWRELWLLMLLQKWLQRTELSRLFIYNYLLQRKGFKI